jgi:hypothetical protein
MKKLNLNRLLLLCFVLSFALILCRTFLVPATDLDGRHFIRGDGYSDQNVYSTVLWVRDFGFKSSAFRAVTGYSGSSVKSEGHVYTHYPSLPDISIAAWSRAINTVYEPALRIFPLFLSLILLGFIWQLFKIFNLTETENKLNLALILLSGYFILWADCLHKHLWENLVNFAFAVGLFKFYNEGRKASWYLYFLPLAFIATQASFETYVTVATLVVGCSIVFEKGFKKIISPLNLYLGFLFVGGFLFHLGLNSIALGSMQNAINDLTSAFSYRTQGIAVENTQMTWLKKLELIWLFINRQERYYFIPGPALAIFFYWFYKYKLKDQNQKAFLCVLLASSFSWYLAMPQHAYVHHFTAKHSGLWVTVISASGLIELRRRARDNNKSLPAIWAYRTLALYIFIMGFTQIIFSIWWRYSLRYLF